MTVDLRWARVVEATLAHPKFSEAWEAVGEAGVGSEKAVGEIWKLLVDSRMHAKNLTSLMNDIVDDAGEWTVSILKSAGVYDMHVECEFDRTALERFQKAVAHKVSTSAACYLLIGILVGFLLNELNDRD